MPYATVAIHGITRVFQRYGALSPFTSCFIICRHFETISCVPWIHESFHVLKPFAVLLPEVLWKQKERKEQSGIINLAGCPGQYRMPWRSSEEPKPSGNKSCSSSVRLCSFSWDERKRSRHARPGSTCITPLNPWRSCGLCPARCGNNRLTRRREGGSWKLKS